MAPRSRTRRAVAPCARARAAAATAATSAISAISATAVAWLSIVVVLGGCASATGPEPIGPAGADRIVGEAGGAELADGADGANHPVALDMHAMAGSVRRILETSLEAGLDERERRGRTLAELDAIESLASAIDVRRMNTPWTMPWSVVDRYMGAFLHDVGVARSFAMREPANLVPATRLINSCLACHGSL